MVTGNSDEERHLFGCTALVRSSRESIIDPCAGNLKQAAFWVYVRQSLYNACIYQTPPNLDTSLELGAVPVATDYLSELRSETGWANTMTWICAKVVQFSFARDRDDVASRSRLWDDLSSELEQWLRTRPASFAAMNFAERSIESQHAEYWFAADWHGKDVSGIT